MGALLYLACLGTAFTFVVLTLLLRELSTLAMSYLPLLLPFGALLFGAALKDERADGSVARGRGAGGRRPRRRAVAAATTGGRRCARAGCRTGSRRRGAAATPT